MHLHPCTTREDFAALVNAPEFTVRWMLESQLARAGHDPMMLAGFCAPCLRAVEFQASYDGAWVGPDGLRVPNWREVLRCPACTMNGRQRIVAQLIVDWVMNLPQRETVHAYMMEQVSALHGWATATFPWVRWIGSEYLGRERAPGEEHDGIRHEDAEALSLADASQDLVVSCEVLEHVNDPVAAMREIARVLRPGGLAILTFPMDPTLARNRRRAQEIDGAVRHLLPEIYHGNPLSPAGSLVFTDFGWEVLDQLRGVGLSDATLTVYWSYLYGYLGVQFYFAVHRDGAPPRRGTR